MITSAQMISENTLKRRVDDGHATFGYNVVSASPQIIESLGRTPLDYVWIDLEHTGPSPTHSTSLETIARAAESANIEPMIRLPDANQKTIGKVLDTGINTILISKVEDGKGAKKAVDAANFPVDGFEGDRGAPLARSTGWGPPSREFLSEANEEACVGVMLETVKAYENIDEILSVPDLGFAFIGPADLSISMGHPLETDHEKVKEYTELAVETAEEHDVPLGRIANDEASINTALDNGFNIIRIGVDVFDVPNYVSNMLNEL